VKENYIDITERLCEPRWWDEVGVPRYCEPSPKRSNNIYADEVVFYRIRCQDCGRPFVVCTSRDRYQRWHRDESGEMVQCPSLAELVQRQQLGYGDPPNIDCCAAGPTMTSVAETVLEFWRRKKRGEFERVRELEGLDLTPAWWGENAVLGPETATEFEARFAEIEREVVGDRGKGDEASAQST
jgi:hypothetical protein